MEKTDLIRMVRDVGSKTTYLHTPIIRELANARVACQKPQGKLYTSLRPLERMQNEERITH